MTKSRMRLLKSHKPDESLIEKLASLACAYGDDAQRHSEALLILMDEIERAEPQDVAVITHAVKYIAFARLVEEDSELMDAQIALLRGEL